MCDFYFWEEVIIIPAKGSKKGVWYNCEWCGQLKYTNLHHYNQVKHHFCSQQCSIKFREANSREYRLCEVCGKEMYVLKKSTQRFCSDACQNKWQKARIGFSNPRFKGDEITCDWCNKKFLEDGYSIKTKKNHFCSVKCRREWYAQIWSQSSEWKKMSRERAVKILESGTNPQIQSRPQIALNKLLDDMGVKCINEYSVKYYAVDNYLSDYNLFIEVMGDYWHCNPMCYPIIKYQQQKDAIRRDRAKRTYITKTYNIHILYLWESDINKNQKLCKSLIQMFINRNGQLQNYNSFNYHLDGDVVTLNNDIVLSYSELPKIELKQKLCLVS